MNENIYYIKYLKYKMKYLKEKEMQLGGFKYGETDKSIFFLSTSPDFNFLSNFYLCNFNDPKEKKQDGSQIQFNCNEQYFMYQKAKTCNSNEEVKNYILTQTDPKEIRKAGGPPIKGGVINMSAANAEKWEKVKLGVMRRGLALKFSQSQNKQLKDNLLATGGKNLYEANKYDTYWGIGFDVEIAMAKEKEEPSFKFPGNNLGKLLMELRAVFRTNYNYTVSN